MRFDYRKDAPVPGVCPPPFTSEELCAHRDRHMGDEAAKLNVWLDALEKPRTAQELYFMNRAAFPPRLRAHEEEIRGAAGCYAAHEIYFRGFSANAEIDCPRGDAARLLRESFGSVENFYYSFRTSAENSCGSGFLWLLSEEKGRRRGGALKIVFTPPAVLPPACFKPLLALDLWEHAWESRFRKKANYADAYLTAFDWSRLIK